MRCEGEAWLNHLIRCTSAVLACMTNPFYPIDLLVTIRAFTRERIGNGGCKHETGRYPDQLSLTGLRLGSGTILVLFARAGAAAAAATATGTSTAA